MSQPLVFQQSTESVVLLQGRPHPSAGVATGVLVIVGDRVGVNVFDRVAVDVGVSVRVGEIVFVAQAVQVRESVGGQVIVRVGLNGLTQQIVRSTQDMHTCWPESGVMQNVLAPPATHPGQPPV